MNLIGRAVALYAALGALLLVAPVVRAQPAIPPLTAAVNDFANVIDPTTERELERRIRALIGATGDTVVIATVPNIEGYADIGEYRVKMFENGGRGIGQKGQDNGLLIVVAIAERQVGIEVGYDLEGFITDGTAGSIIRERIRPEFRNGNYGSGLVSGTTALINRIAQGRGVQLEGVPAAAPPATPRRTTGMPSCWPFMFILILFMLMGRGGRRRRRRWGGSGWSSGVGPFGGGLGGGFGGGFGGFGGGGFGGGGGGFGGFGGGRSGGGGASGGW